MIIDYKNPTKEEQMYLAITSPIKCMKIENLDKDIQDYLISKDIVNYNFIKIQH